MMDHYHFKLDQIRLPCAVGRLTNIGGKLGFEPKTRTEAFGKKFHKLQNGTIYEPKKGFGNLDPRGLELNSN